MLVGRLCISCSVEVPLDPGHLRVLAGARRQELLDLEGQDFAREGWIRIVGKGAKHRWVPVLPELVPVVAEIRGDVGA